MRKAIWNGILLAVAGALAFQSVTNQQTLPAGDFVSQPPALKVASADGGGPLFTTGAVLIPGRGVVRTVTLSQPSRVAFFVTNFNPRSADSAPTCTASDPADRINFSIRSESGNVYQGTLAGFAEHHSSARSALPLEGPRSRTIIFKAVLDPGAGNAYMGCRSTADFNWDVA